MEASVSPAPEWDAIPVPEPGEVDDQGRTRKQCLAINRKRKAAAVQTDEQRAQASEKRRQRNDTRQTARATKREEPLLADTLLDDEAACSVLSELASSALEEWVQDPGQAVDALIALHMTPPTWSGLPCELAVQALLKLPLRDIRAVSVCSKENVQRARLAWARRCPGWVCSLAEGDSEHVTLPCSDRSPCGGYAGLATHAGLFATASGTTSLVKTAVSGDRSSWGAFHHDGKVQVGRPSDPCPTVFSYSLGLAKHSPADKYDSFVPNRVLTCESLALSETRLAIVLTNGGNEILNHLLSIGGYFIWYLAPARRPRGASSTLRCAATRCARANNATRPPSAHVSPR